MQNSKKNFERASFKAASRSLTGLTWTVYESYDVHRQSDDVFVCAPFRPPRYESERIYDRPPEDLGLKRHYCPLKDYPDLFLRFASLYRKDICTEEEILEIVLSWVEDYGVLGLEGVDHLKIAGRSAHRMGRRESLSKFWREAREAARVLAFYEAATAPIGPDKQLTKTLEAWVGPSITTAPLSEKREYALSFVSDRVGSYVRNDCYPILWRTVDKERDHTLDFRQGLGFHSLLGAMYLQMMWLMIEGDGARRCERPGCIRIVTFDPPPAPEGSFEKGARGKYRTRRDKKYCSTACKQWVYDQAKRQSS